MQSSDKMATQNSTAIYMPLMIIEKVKMIVAAVLIILIIKMMISESALIVPLLDFILFIYFMH